MFAAIIVKYAWITILLWGFLYLANSCLTVYVSRLYVEIGKDHYAGSGFIDTLPIEATLAGDISTGSFCLWV
jgi:hypothetical protein